MWERIREQLDAWFEDYPPSEARDLRARFRSPDPAQHWGAWWELYLFTLFRKLEFEVVPHPELPSAAGRPDFALTRGENAFYVEAATVFSGIVEEDRDGRREAWIKDAINSARDPNFFVSLEFKRVGKERPAIREIKEPLERWLRDLDPDDVVQRNAIGGDLPSMRLAVRDWHLEFSAFPIKRESRGDPAHRLLGAGPASGGFVNDREMLKKTFERKRRRYGRPDLPLVLAVLGASSFLEDTDVEQALFGTHAVSFELGTPGSSRWVRQPDGFWSGSRGPRGTRVSAVLIGHGLMPWTCARDWPRLWLNPWARRPFSVTTPFPTRFVTSEHVLGASDSTRVPASVLGLDAAWPGPEPPFDD